MINVCVLQGGWKKGVNWNFSCDNFLGNMRLFTIFRFFFDEINTWIWSERRWWIFHCGFRCEALINRRISLVRGGGLITRYFQVEIQLRSLTVTHLKSCYIAHKISTVFPLFIVYNSFNSFHTLNNTYQWYK